MTETSNDKPKIGGVIGKSTFYAKVSKHGEAAIDKLVGLMNCGIPAVEMGAAKTLLNKIIPDLKAVEMTGEGGKEVLIKFFTSYDTNTGKGLTGDSGVQEETTGSVQ